MTEKKDHPSFTKSLFSGLFLDELVFPYPMMNKEEEENLNLIRDTIHKFCETYVDSAEFDRQEKFPEDVINGMKELGLFGLVIPEEYGGYGLSTTAYVKILEKVASFDGSMALIIGAHQSIGLKGLLLYGTEDQKQKYLPILATGEMIAAFALTEPGAGSDAAGIKTRAVRDEEKGVYVLNGSKLWITNGGIADFFTIFAKEEIDIPGEGKKDKISAFIVTREMGVQSGKKEEKMGIRATSTAELILENVEVPIDNILGVRGKGFKVAMEILNTGRVGLAGGNVGGSKSALKYVLNHVKERHQFGRPLISFEIIREKISQIALRIFVAESMVYLTTSLIDKDDIDFSLETAMCKIYATDTLWRTANDCLQMAGGIGFSREYPYEQWVRDARINPIFEGTNEILRIFTALSGLQERGEYLKKIGKALNDPIKGFGLLTDYAVHYMKDRLTKEHIPDVHPALTNAKASFEEWAKNLHITSERILVKYGKDIIKKQIIQWRIAEAAINLFGMIATISRVDQCIKLKGDENCQKMITLCNTFCGQAWRRVRRNLLMIDKNDDGHLLNISDFIAEDDGYKI
jgi:acyl-CoA dehydrogenase family protein 9